MSRTLAAPVPAGPVVPRQKRAILQRAALLDAVETVVAREGEEAVTTTRIAQASGVSVGTVYRYFEDRDALVLAAYDRTVERLVETCGEALAGLGPDLPARAAAQHLLGVYLDAAVEIPSHAPLLRAMRRIRPIDADQEASNQMGVMGELFLPFIALYGSGAQSVDPVRLQFMGVMISTMVDLYLVTADAGDRERLRAEMETHIALMVERAWS